MAKGKRYILYWLDHATTCPECGAMMKTGQVPKNFVKCRDCGAVFKRLHTGSVDREMEYVRTR